MAYKKNNKKSNKTLDYWPRDTLNFFLEKGLGMVSLSHFAYDFSRKMFLMLPVTIAQKMKFSIKDFFSKCDQIRRKKSHFLRTGSHLLKKSLIENFNFCAVYHSVIWSNFVFWFLLLLEILSNMCISITCFPGCEVINFEINLAFLIKPFF